MMPATPAYIMVNEIAQKYGLRGALSFAFDELTHRLLWKVGLWG